MFFTAINCPNAGKTRYPAGLGTGGTASAAELTSIEELRLYLSSGSFYFGYDWDATKNLQRSSTSDSQGVSWHDCELSFFWNHHMLKPIIDHCSGLPLHLQNVFKQPGLFIVCFQGFAAVKSNPSLSAQPESFCAVISRVSCKRAGSRFRSRGIDDDGNVSNFVETETMYFDPNYSYSHLLTRGTVPVFWDQQGFQLGFPKIQITRTPVATQPAFDRHITNLKEHYGLIHIVDLLSQKEGQAEKLLSTAFDFHIRKYPEVGVVSHTSFDLYSVCRNFSFERLESLFHHIARDLQSFGYFTQTVPNGEILKEQRGIFRVNCLDCLDRTNIVQSYLACRTIDLFRRNFLMKNTTLDASALQDNLKSLWIQNGDCLSRIYAGTDTIKSSYGRLDKLSLSSFITDIKTTARRLYENNFLEKQKTIELLLGKHSNSTAVPIYSFNLTECDSESTLSQHDHQNILVQVLTWNTNASYANVLEDASMLVSIPKGLPTPHVLAVGLQEIVRLNASQIMSADPERRVFWENLISTLLAEYYPKHQFSHLVSHQLVGTAISIFVRSDYLHIVRQVEIASKKTGMGGIAGNKGSVAVRLRLHDTSLCFVSSHFTAGQNNIVDRDRDFEFALSELQLSGGRNILAHDYVFWFGDLNYRIDLDRDIARDLIREKKFGELLKHDQLTERRTSGLVFQGFSEGSINFAPTYKYDTGTNIYDTSDKMRVPSWTDRILFRGDAVSWRADVAHPPLQITSLFYNRAEIDVSDHKPVKGVFEILIKRAVDSNPFESDRSPSKMSPGPLIDL